MENSNNGSILVLVCLLLFLVLTLAMVLADQAMKDSVRQGANGPLLKDVYEAIVGVPGEGRFGYLGDVGDYPASLTDLLNDPGLTGWNGPYLSNAPVANGMMYDSYGSPLEYFFNLANGSLDQITVISRGPDHSSDNTAANPNVDSQFMGTLPSAAGYAAANPDNEIYPDFVTDVNSLSREAVGTLTYDIQNFNQHSLSNAMVAGCPGLYSLVIRSVTRGTADTTTLTYPSTLYNQSLEAQLLQGVYDVQIMSQESQNAIWRERVTITPGTTLRRSVIAPRIDSSTTPSFTITIYNHGASNYSIRSFTNVIGTVNTGSPNGPIRSFTTTNTRACQLMTAVVGGSTVHDTWIMPYGNYTRVIKNTPQTTYTLTVTNGGANDDVIKVVHKGHPGTTAINLVVGTVYKRKTKAFLVPGSTNTNIPIGNQGVVIEYQKRDGTVISTNTYTGNQTVTVP